MSNNRKWEFESDGRENKEIGKKGKDSIKKVNKYREVLSEQEHNDEINDILFGSSGGLDPLDSNSEDSIG
jgi:hypothetical protein